MEDLEEIEEDLPQSEDGDGGKFLVESMPGTGIGASQSLGVDPSVDSLALDDYDHIEYVDP